MSVSSLILFVCVLIRVAFFTLIERKILGYIHIRKGPNKVGLRGLLQPFRDALKLFTKEQSFPYLSNLNLYYICPIINIFLSLLLWVCVPYISVLLNFNLSVLFFLSLSRLGVYTIILAGWSSNSNYAILGSLRAVAQSISYEVRLVLILISFLFIISRFNFIELSNYQEMIWFMFLFLPIIIMWIVSRLAETNRSPFDFAEAESELVSGFNVEYRRGGFALIFIAEYTRILLISTICVLLFIGANMERLLFFVKIVFFAFFWVWVRGTLPRYRYDKLMYLSWKIYLPVALNIALFYYSLRILIYSLFI